MTVQATLNRIEEKLDKVIVVSAKNEQHLSDINGSLKDHAKQIECNEQEISKLKGYVNKGLGAIAMLVIMTKIFF